MDILTAHIDGMVRNNKTGRGSWRVYVQNL